MHKHLEHDQNHQKKQESSDIQESIFHTFKQTQKLEENNEANEKLDKDIEVFQRLAQYYYDIDTHADEQKLDNDKLYTILLYQGNEILVPIGVGKYTSEMFTDKHLTDSVWFLYGPLNLFVVKTNTYDDDVPPRTFLNEYASFYSPIGGQVYMHTQNTPIEYGKYNKIMSYEEAVNALQNADIRKEFYSRMSSRNNVDEKFCKDMKKLKEKTQTITKTTEKLEVRYDKVKFDYDHEEYMKMRNCLACLSDENIQKMYDLIQSFDWHKGVFLTSDNI